MDLELFRQKLEHQLSKKIGYVEIIKCCQLEELLSHPRLTEIKELNLSYNTDQAQSIKISNLLSINAEKFSLEKIYMREMSEDSELLAIKFLWESKISTRLLELDFSYSRFDINQFLLQMINSGIQMKLRVLKLMNINSVNNNTLSLLVKTKTFQLIEELYLLGNDIDDEGIKNLADGFHLNLKVLELSSTNVTEASFPILANSK